ncbi:MAG: hypothetical protein AB1742_02500 [bacterium]
MRKCTGSSRLTDARAAQTALRALLPALAAALLLPAAAGAIVAPYTITGDYNVFNVDTKIVSSTGRTELTYGALRIQADSMRVDVVDHVVIARGGVSLMSAVTDSPGAQTRGADGGDGDDLDHVILMETEGKKKIYEGDTLIYDLDALQGILIQTRGRVGKIYLWGENLDETAELQSLKTYDDLYDDPGIADSNVTAEKFRISPNEKYEAWKVTMWVKGSRIISLPYFTNTGRGMLPGKWRLRKASYSTNNNLSLQGEIRYKEAPDKKGFLTVDYRDKGERHLLLALNQQFSLGPATAASLNVSNLLAGGRRSSLRLNRFQSSDRFQSLSLYHQRDENQSLDFNLSFPWKKQSVQASLNAYRHPALKSGTLSVNLVTQSRSRYLDGKRKLGMRFSSYVRHYDSEPGSNAEGSQVTNAYVGVSFFRTAVNIGSKTHVSATVNAGHGAGTDGDVKNNLGVVVSFNRRIGRASALDFSYSNNRNASSRSPASRQSYLRTALSLGGGGRWNSRLSTGYDLARSNFSDMSLSLDYRFNRRTSIASSFSYSLEHRKFLSGAYFLEYNMHGTTVNTVWNKENNDFIIDFNSQFK